MNAPDRWQRVGELFTRTLAVPPADREAFVRESGEPEDIQDEVLILVASHDESQGFLEPPALLTEGAMVGPYRIERILGRGGMGVVYLGKDTRLHRPVALKSLPPHLFRDDKMRDRLRQEARAAGALSHPSIATVYALEEIGDQIFIASEYLEGRTLREEIRSGPLSEARVLDIARSVAAGLQAAHDRRIVHRDLKPENIMITSNGGVKILDFGLAQFDVAVEEMASVTRLTEAGILAGTPPYMAPEQLLGQKTSARTDQFAFGVLLYEMLTGRHPFGSGSLSETIARTLATNPDTPEPGSGVWSIVKRTLQKNPDDRFPSTKDLVAALAGGLPPVGTRTLGTLGTLGTPETPRNLFWWTVHQLVVALAYWFMVWPTWHVHKWTGRYGVFTFLATLAIVIVGGNTRLHLGFTARYYPAKLALQLANVRRLVRAADVAFSIVMIGIGLVLANAHTGWSALFVAFGLGGALAFLVIEPATERAEFGSAPDPKSA